MTARLWQVCKGLQKRIEKLEKNKGWQGRFGLGFLLGSKKLFFKGSTELEAWKNAVLRAFCVRKGHSSRGLERGAPAEGPL